MCYHINSPKNLKMLFSGKDELMGNLKAAALACGVVASVLAGGVGVAYITSSTVSSADIALKEDTVLPLFESVSDSTSVTSAEAEKAATYNRATTKRSYTAEITTASTTKNALTEGTTSQRATEAATTASEISRSVPAPAHAPAAITQPASQEPATTAADIAADTTSSAEKPVTTTTTATTAATTTTVTTTVNVEFVETPTEETTQDSGTDENTESEDNNTAEAPVVEEESSLPITDAEFILLCNAVANEAGSNWISEYDKALVVEVIMNRVNSPLFPNSIYDVLTQRNQFTGAYKYVDLTTYSSYVTQSVKDAVMRYFNDTESFTQGYLYFSGDGYRNYFR